LLADATVATYPYLSAARADTLRRLALWEDAVVGYEEAIALTGNDVERDFLLRRLAEVRARLGG
jgi:RNA polymerase sigma-70 factor (ECF subfamily)